MSFFITNGSSVSIADFPTSIIFFNYGAMCAGTILNSWTILTAAHCFLHNKNVADMLVQVGTTQSYEMGADRYEVLYFEIHPLFSALTEFDSDIALIFVLGPILLGQKVQKALLVKDQEWVNSTEEAEFIATGWGLHEKNGKINDEGLMMTRLRLVPNKECEKLHDVPITHNMICLYGNGVTDTCRGDSGGGITWRGYLVGIVSHGDGCATANKPSIYTNVYNFVDWIHARVTNFFNKYCSSNGFQLDVV